MNQLNLCLENAQRWHFISSRDGRCIFRWCCPSDWSWVVDVPPSWVLGLHSSSADQGGPCCNHKAGEQEEEQYQESQTDSKDTFVLLMPPSLMFSRSFMALFTSQWVSSSHNNPPKHGDWEGPLTPLGVKILWPPLAQQILFLSAGCSSCLIHHCLHVLPKPPSPSCWVNLSQIGFLAPSSFAVLLK